MAQMNIDLDRIGRMTESDLDDKKERKRLVQYLFQLAEQLKYFQFNIETENMSPELQVVMKKLTALANAVGELQEESDEPMPEITITEIKGSDVKMTGTNTARITGTAGVSMQSGADMSLLAAGDGAISAEELVITGYTLLKLLGSSVLQIDGTDAASFIRLAYTASGAAFMATGAGNLTATNAHFENLYVGGQDLPTVLEAYRDRRLQVSATQPAGEDIVWVQPESSSEVERIILYNGTSSSGSFMNNTYNERTVTCTCSDTGLQCSTVAYGIGFLIYNNSDTSCNLLGVTVSLSGTLYGGGAGTVQVINDSYASGRYTVGPGDYVDYSSYTYRHSGVSNLTGSGTITATIGVTFDVGGSRSMSASSFQIRVKGTEGSGVSDGEPIPCSVFYIPPATE